MITSSEGLCMLSVRGNQVGESRSKSRDESGRSSPRSKSRDESGKSSPRRSSSSRDEEGGKSSNCIPGSQKRGGCRRQSVCT